MPDALLEVDSINVWRGASQVLHDVSLSVGEGEIVALLGGNGAGKTSTLATISGLLHPKSGDIRFSTGQESISLPSLRPDRIVRLGIAHSPEGRQIFGGLSVVENLRMGAFLRHDKEIDADIERFYELFPILGERAELKAGQLSGGEQMMLGLARALMSRPRLLMLDEPSLGLAPQVIDQIFDRIEEIRAQGTTVFLVEQNAAMALEVADRAYVIENGRIAISGEARQLAEDPSVRKAYLGIEMSEDAPVETTS
ncbi:ABC transporter ATP-binding protein [Fodinicurvata halophila]|uniref:ABC transporter ATP-binding protein n=1 Tax=Fodinicurvata halophila TaxID=1419723 RepID=A0ABV8UN75_9PROT